MQLLKQLRAFLDRLRSKWIFVPPQSRRTSPKYRLNFSWVIPGKLAVGGLPRSGDTAILSQAQIKVVLSLCAKSEHPLPEDILHEFRCLRLVLPDSHYQAEIQPAQLAQATDVIHRSTQNQWPIYVHCLAGIERSPTVCIAYLCRYCNLELWEAVHWMKQVHPYSMPTESQLRAVRQMLISSNPPSSSQTQSESVNPASDNPSPLSQRPSPTPVRPQVSPQVSNPKLATPRSPQQQPAKPTPKSAVPKKSLQ